ncbi:MAG: hypothetical protein D6790_09225 [Caldilineae bacterium]|nr:MAG: hypothetical protein D6790_09225 [Caldilineae bacterium]
MLRDVAAALELGDLGLLAPEIEWIEGLLVHHHIPQEHLLAFMRRFHAAALKHLGEEGRPVLAWLERCLAGATA